MPSTPSLLRHGLVATAGLGALPAALAAGTMAVQVELPRLQVSEYHRPYVAVWIERADRSVPATLAVWYMTKTRGKDSDEGIEWLKDLRQWWRRTGRELSVPIDGVTGPTRPAGTHELRLAADSAPLRDLAPGAYKVMVEAAREVGGRELLSLPFDWPPSAASSTSAQGKSELGAVRLDLEP